MITRYGRALLISASFFFLVNLTYSGLRDARVLKIGYFQTQKTNEVIYFFSILAAGVLFESSSNFFRIDVLDNINKLKIRHHK